MAVIPDSASSPAATVGAVAPVAPATGPAAVFAALADGRTLQARVLAALTMNAAGQGTLRLATALGTISATLSDGAAHPPEGTAVALSLDPVPGGVVRLNARILPDPPTPDAPDPVAAGSLAVRAAVVGALARHQGPAPVVARAVQLAAAPDVPDVIREAARSVVAARLVLDVAPTPAGIAAAVARSGVFLEARLADGLPPVPGDLKAALLTLRAALGPTPGPDIAPSPLLAAGTDLRQSPGLAAAVPAGAVVPSATDAAPATTGGPSLAAGPDGAAAPLQVALPPGAKPAPVAPAGLPPPRTDPVALRPEPAAPLPTGELPKIVPAVPGGSPPEVPAMPASDFAPQAAISESGPDGHRRSSQADADLPPLPGRVAPPMPGAVAAAEAPPVGERLLLRSILLTVQETAGALLPALVADREPAAGKAAPMPPQRGTWPAAEPPVAAGDPVAEGPALMRAARGETEAALARLVLDQYASLPPDGADPAPRPGENPLRAERHWSFEVPVQLGPQSASLRFQVEGDGGGHGGGGRPAAPSWRLRLAFDIEPLGPVRAQVGLVAGRIAVGIWADRPATVAALGAEAPMLRDALLAADFDVDDIHLGEGLPPGSGSAAARGVLVERLA